MTDNVRLLVLAIALFVGAVIVSVGVGMVYLPAGFIAGGLLLAAVALVAVRDAPAPPVVVTDADAEGMGDVIDVEDLT